MDDRRSPPSHAAYQVSPPQASSPPIVPRCIITHVAKDHVKYSQGPRDLPGLTPGDAVTPFGIPSSPRDKDPASWYPCLAVVRDHVKHTQGPQDLPTSIAEGGTQKAAPPLPPCKHLSAHLLCLSHRDPGAAGTPNIAAQGSPDDKESVCEPRSHRIPHKIEIVGSKDPPGHLNTEASPPG